MTISQTRLSFQSLGQYRDYHQSTMGGKRADGLTVSVTQASVLFSSRSRINSLQNFEGQNTVLQINQVTHKRTPFHNEKPVLALSQDQAGELVNSKGYFGVEKTSQRIAEFVVKGAAGDLERLQQGRAGVLKGFAEAEEIWGEQLPDLSYQTLTRALETIDAAIREEGGSLLDLIA